MAESSPPAAGSPGAGTSPEPDLTGPQATWRVRVFGSIEYFWLWIAQVVSAFGDWIGFFAIAALAAEISTAPEAAIALVITARVAPSVVLAPIIGVLIDRFDRRRLMIISDIARAGVFCALPFIRTVPGLVVASFLLEIFTLVWSPSKEALVPSLVPANKLASANSLGLVAAYGTMPIAGLFQFVLAKGNDALADVAWLEPLQFNAALGETQALAFYVDALTFLATAGIVFFFIPKGLSHLVSRTNSDGEKLSARSQIREGWKYIVTSPVIRAVHVGLAAGLLGGAMLVPLGPLFAADVLGDPDTFALFITALGFGVAIGVSGVSALQEKIDKQRVFISSIFAAGGSLIYAVSMSSFWLAAMGITLLGVCAGTVYVLGFTLLHQTTSDELRGRIFSTLIILVRICVLMALWLGPVLSAVFDKLARDALDTPPGQIPSIDLLGATIAIPGSRTTLWLAGVIILIAGMAAAHSMNIGVRESMHAMNDSPATPVDATTDD